MAGLSSGDSWVHMTATRASIAASVSFTFPWRLASMKSRLHDSAEARMEATYFLFPERIWKRSTPKAYTSLFSVKRPVFVYSGARYPIAALALSDEKTVSSVRSLCRHESESRGSDHWLISTFLADMFWCTRDDGLLAFLHPCKYSIPAPYQQINDLIRPIIQEIFKKLKKCMIAIGV